MAAIGVGLIGANPDKGWGSAVHIPALQCLPGFALAAVATTNMASARASAARFGAPHAYDDPAHLIADPHVDLVTIAVKAPDHHRLAMLALEAGKHVYCEWPLAATTGGAEEMAGLADRKAVRTMVGLQARGAPALLHARALIAEEYVGRIVSVRMHCALPGGGARRSREGLYVIRKASGAGTLAIQGGHAIDALQTCVGRLVDIRALVANQFPEVEVIETGERLAKDAPDQILACARTEAGAIVSIAVNGGVVAGYGVSIDIFGERGTLSIRGEGGLNFQMGTLSLFGARAPERVLSPVAIPESYDPGLVPADAAGAQPYPGVDVPRATLVNVCNLYREMESAIRQRRAPSPDFRAAVALHRLLDLFEAASETGRAQRPRLE